MDIVEVVREAAGRLPEGEYSVGLSAIIRHLETAIRHYQRDPIEEPDCYTDSIYRTNQAYEGSLKEAYRALAEKDPSGKTPNEIEKYLESNSVLRQRVLIQLTRYRQDYRNPSAHDYKLDFDANEALLSIVSVSAFAKLLFDQIAEKVAFEVSASKGGGEKILTEGTADEVTSRIADFVRDWCNRSEYSGVEDHEFEAALAGGLTSAGIPASNAYVSDYMWDVVAEPKGKKIAIETRMGDNRHSVYRLIPLHYLYNNVRADGFDGGIVVTRTKQKGNYAVLKATKNDLSYYLVTKLDRKSVEAKVGKGWSIEL